VSRPGGRAANIAVALSGLVLLTSFVNAWFAHRMSGLGVESWAILPEALVDTQARPYLVETVDGDTVRVEPGEIPAVLIVYSPNCRFCDLSVRNWRRLARSICDEAQVIAVSRDPLEAQRRYWSDHGVLGRPDCAVTPLVGRLIDASRFGTQYGVRVTPTIFIISAGGSATHVWAGASGRRAALDSLLAAVGGLP
jgi:peroxiredoxin